MKHAAVDMGCSSCHIDHRQPAAGAERIAHYLNAKQPGLCLTCHEAGDKQVAAAHKGQPYEKAICTGCHDPHASDLPKMMAAQQHGPYGARQCGGCHQAPQDGKIRLTVAAVSDLCYGCHDEMKKRVAAAKFRHTLLSDGNSCVDCHDPHSSNRPHFLKQPQPALCNACHAGVTEGKRFQHEPVQVSCTLCHDAHASDVPKNLHAQLNGLCLECHSADAAEKIQKPGPVALFDGRAGFPAGAFQRITLLPVRAGADKGHPFAKHPVFTPASDGKPETNCLTCHRPHAANGSPYLFANESPTSTTLCVQCHK